MVGVCIEWWSGLGAGVGILEDSGCGDEQSWMNVMAGVWLIQRG